MPDPSQTAPPEHVEALKAMIAERDSIDEQGTTTEPYEPNDTDLRMTALYQAVQTRHELDRPVDVVKAAGLYLDFLRGEGGDS